MRVITAFARLFRWAAAVAAVVANAIVVAMVAADAAVVAVVAVAAMVAADAAVVAVTAITVITAVTAVTAVAAVAPAAAQSVAVPTVGTPLAAVWKERHVDFMYRGRTARYSCDGLHDKVRAMLLDLGARRDVKIEAVGCAADDRLRSDSARPSLSIVFSAPALPDAGAKPLRAGDLAATDARFVAFSISSDAFRNMGMGDCELVEEFARQILPKFVTRHVTQDITCVRFGQRGSRFLVRGDLLKTLPREEQAAGRDPIQVP